MLEQGARVGDLQQFDEGAVGELDQAVGRAPGVLRAGGDNRFTLITDSLVMWGFGVPIYTAAVFFSDLSFVYLYLLLYLEDALKFIPVIKRIASRKWMNNLAHH